MNFQFYFEKLMHSEEFQKFKKENPTAFLCSGFFSIDKKNQNNGDNQQHLDYFIPETKKLFSFRFIKGNIELIPTENFNENFEFEKIPDNLDFDFNKVERIIEGKMFDEKINKEIEKILLSLQRKEGKDYLIGTVFISGLGMIKISIDLNDNAIIDFEKKSFFDILRVKKKED